MRVRWQLALLLSLLLLAPVSAHTQQQSASPPTPYILHAYANLVQIPALAVDTDFNPLPPLDRKQFFIRLDSGPSFHPTKIHIEGDEPLNLAILLDASGDQNRLIRAFAPAIAQLAQTSLTPRDRVSVFALDCTLVRSSLDLPADPDTLQTSVDKALAAPTLHNGKDRGTCGRSLHLWDATAQAIHTLADLPGRRVLLIVSSGYDHKSTYSPVTIRHYADANSVAIFAMRDLARYEGDVGLNNLRRYPAELYFALGDSPEDNFTELCESNGGVIITLTQQELAPGLERFISMLRGRYILEFPRPDDRAGGDHRIDVTIPSQQTFLVTTGVSVPLPDQARDSDPTTVPSSPSPAVLGKRHPMTPNN